MPKHKIEIQATDNGRWTINGANPEILHAFAHFYNTMSQDRQQQFTDTFCGTHGQPIIIDNQTGQIIRAPRYQKSKR